MEEEESWKAFFYEANRYLKQWNLSLPITEFPTFSHASESVDQKRKTLEKQLSNRNDLITRIDQVYAQDLACFSFDPADAKLQTPTQ